MIWLITLMNFSETSGFSRYGAPFFNGLCWKYHSLLVTYAHENGSFIVFISLCDWNPGALHPGQLEGVGHLVFEKMFRALHVLNLFNLTGKTSTWLQRSLSPTPHPGVQVQSRTWLAQKCPSRPWEMHFWGGVCTHVWSNHERWWLQDGTGNKRLRRGMGEVYKGPLQEVDSKKKTQTQALKLESSMDTRQQGALSATN